MTAMMSDRDKVWLIILTYNEADNIGLLIKRVLSVLPSTYLVIVDDNSPDGTAEVVGSLHGLVGADEIRPNSFRQVSLQLDRIFRCSFKESFIMLLRILVRLLLSSPTHESTNGFRKKTLQRLI